MVEGWAPTALDHCTALPELESYVRGLESRSTTL